MAGSFEPPAIWMACVEAPACGELDGETAAAAVRGPPALEAGRGAGGGESAVDLVDAEADDRIPRFW